MQEERQRGGKPQKVKFISFKCVDQIFHFFSHDYLKNDDLNNSSTNSVFVNNGPARDVTLERLLEADQMSDSKCGDKSIQFLRISSNNTMVPSEYRVGLKFYDLFILNAQFLLNF